MSRLRRIGSWADVASTRSSVGRMLLNHGAELAIAGSAAKTQEPIIIAKKTKILRATWIGPIGIEVTTLLSISHQAMSPSRRHNPPRYTARRFRYLLPMNDGFASGSVDERQSIVRLRACAMRSGCRSKPNGILASPSR
jgi:hypothetical protein